MKLDRCAILAASLVGLAGLGCGARPSESAVVRAPATTEPSAVSTTRVMAAELSDPDDAPKVGKSQRAVTADDGDDTEDGKAAGRRPRADRRPGGGFSGYK